MDCCLRINRAVNGYVVSYDDPEIRRRNRNNNDDTPWEDPEKSLVFSDKDTLVEGIASLVDALPEPENTVSTEYEAAFKEAVSKV